MNNVRIGIIGMGNIGRFHAGYLLEGRVRGATLAAVCSTSPEKLADYGAKGVEVFGSGLALIQSGRVDAVLVATPHYQHAELGIAALEAGLHLLVEKPIAAHKADAETLIAAARARPDLKFAAMFQLRVEPRYEAIRTFIRDGRLGDLLRVEWTATDWFRSDAYYASSAWRATWGGEGGGVLINQCLHQLDMLQWLVGMPTKVRGFCQLGRFHPIEVEDHVTAYLEWPNRAMGVFVGSTGELPGVNRLEIAGTRGRLLLENDTLSFACNAVPSDEWSRTTKVGFARPDLERGTIPFTNAEVPHAVLTRDFVDAIRENKSLRCPGEEGLGSIELANAIVYSALEDRTLPLPMDGAAYAAFLGKLTASSTHQKKVEASSGDDFASSFRR